MTSTPVTHDDVDAAASELRNLSAADAVVGAMNGEQPNRLASEGTDGAWFGNGGWSETERGQVSDDLAGKLDDANLAAVFNAFERSGGGEEGVNLAGEFATAVSTHAHPNQRVDFIQALSRRRAGRRRPATRSICCRRARSRSSASSLRASSTATTWRPGPRIPSPI